VLPFFVFVTLRPRRSLDFFSGLTRIPTCVRPNSHGIISFTDPRPLTLLESHRFKKGVGRGSITIHSRFSISHSPYTLPSSVFSNPCICHSYGNTGGRGGILPTLELTLTNRGRSAPFLSCTYGSPFCNFFVFKFMHAMGGTPLLVANQGTMYRAPMHSGKGKTTADLKAGRQCGLHVARKQAVMRPIDGYTKK
jgi:hypothetical protein